MYTGLLSFSLVSNMVLTLAAQLKNSNSQISAARSRGSRELKYKVVHICYKAYKYQLTRLTKMHVIQCLTVAEEGRPRTRIRLSSFTLNVTQSICLPGAEAEALFSSRKDYKFIILFLHYHKYFQQLL